MGDEPGEPAPDDTHDPATGDPDEHEPGAPPPAGSLVAGFLGLVDTVSSRVLDHPVRPRARVSPGGLLRGEVDVVRVELPAVLAAGLVLDHVVIRAERVRIAPGLPPRLVTGPVRVDTVVSQGNVDRWTRTARLPARLRLTSEGIVLVTGLGGIRVGEVLTELDVAGSFLRLRPRRATVVGLPAPLVGLLRGYLPLPPLPHQTRLRAVRHGDGEVTASFELLSVDEPLTPGLARRLRSLVGLPGT